MLTLQINRICSAKVTQNGLITLAVRASVLKCPDGLLNFFRHGRRKIELFSCGLLHILLITQMPSVREAENGKTSLENQSYII